MDARQEGKTTRQARRKAGTTAEVGVADDALSAELDQWPAEAPLVPKTAGDRARVALISQPGTIRLSDWTTTDRARANRRARSYTTADPRKLDPDADGAFDARVYHDTDTRRYRIAVRYTPASAAAPHHDSGNNAELNSGHGR